MDRPIYWKAALKRRLKEAEEKFTNGVELDEDDITVMAMMNPDQFDIMVQPKS